MRICVPFACIVFMAFAAASLHAAQGDDDASPPARTIIITEIMYNPNSPEMVGETEWVEIVNVSEHTVEMSNWRLDDEDKKNWSPFSCTLKPGEVAVLVNGDKVTEEDFRAAWDAPPDGSAPTTTTPDEDETPKPKKHKKKSEESDAAMAIGPGTPIAPTHADARQSDPVTTKPAYQIIGVKWGGISNSPKEDDEILQLLDENDKVVCEVNIQEKNGWPSCKKPDGPSIFLADIHVKNLNDGKNWKRSAAGKFGARYNNVTDVFTGKDIGSPGYVPQLSGEAPAAAPAAKKPASSKKPESTPDDGDIDY